MLLPADAAGTDADANAEDDYIDGALAAELPILLMMSLSPLISMALPADVDKDDDDAGDDADIYTADAKRRCRRWSYRCDARRMAFDVA